MKMESSYTNIAVFTWFALMISQARGHGRLMEPVSRASAWRKGFSTPPNYDDNQLFCGGKDHQWTQNGGKCGVCGDPYDGPRQHEAGGKYATGTITARYIQGQTINVEIQITASHKGYFEFRLCPHDDPTTAITQECLDRYVLRQPDGNIRVTELGHVTNYTIPLVLPSDVSCAQCVLQWKYNTGNSWGCEGKHCAVGYGPQEQFYGCADVSISPEQQSPRPVLQQNEKNTSHEQTQSVSSVAQSAEIQQVYPIHTNGHQVSVPQGYIAISLDHGTIFVPGSEISCKATGYYRSLYQYADAFCNTQCRASNCPSSLYCEESCKNIGV